MNKFEVGDRVRILDGRNNPKRHLEWLDEMDKYIGEVHIVERIDSCDYRLSDLGYIMFAEEWLVPAEFTKHDLKEFDIVEFRNGSKTCVVNDFVFGQLSIGGFSAVTWLDDLTDNGTDIYDIMKVYRPTDSLPLDKSKWKDLPLIYERTEVKKMTVEEISKALGYEVKVVK